MQISLLTRSAISRLTTVGLAVLASTAVIWFANAQTFTVDPLDNATGVSPSKTVKFTFSEPMDPDSSGVSFTAFTLPMPTMLDVTLAWSANNTVLTCTPAEQFPANTVIFWSLEATTPDETGAGYVDGMGSFTIAGTNEVTSFSVGKMHFYNQTSSATPTIDIEYPYVFQATATLAANRTANSVTVTLPTGVKTNLSTFPFNPEDYYLHDMYTNLSALNTKYPSGNYKFEVVSSPNQQVTVNLPSSMIQPSVPHISNFAESQAINASQPFLLKWDAWAGATAADHIYVHIYDDNGDVFSTPDLDVAGALTGTAVSVQIPAGKFTAGSNYDGTIGFYRYVGTSNATYTTAAYLVTVTDFTVKATGGGTPATPPAVSKPSWSAGAFNFDIGTTVGQTLTVEYCTNLLANQWYTALTTNSPGTSVHIKAPSVNSKTVFYRVRNGS